MAEGAGAKAQSALSVQMREPILLTAGKRAPRNVLLLLRREAHHMQLLVNAGIVIMVMKVNTNSPQATYVRIAKYMLVLGASFEEVQASAYRQWGVLAKNPRTSRLMVAVSELVLLKSVLTNCRASPQENGADIRLTRSARVRSVRAQNAEARVLNAEEKEDLGASAEAAWAARLKSTNIAILERAKSTRAQSVEVAAHICC